MEEVTSTRGEIDTTPPFKSVRAAVTMFGESADSGAVRVGNIDPLPPAHAHNDQEFHLAVQEDLAKLQEQLALAEDAKIQTVNELQGTKQAVELTKKKLEEASEPAASCGQTQNFEESDIMDAKTCTDLKEEFDLYKEQHTGAVSDLEAAKKEISELKLELQVATVQVREAEVMALEAANKSEELLRELFEPCKSDGDEMPAEPGGEINSKTSAVVMPLAGSEGISNKEVEILRRQLTSAKELELQLAASSSMLAKALAELATAKTSEERMEARATEVHAEFMKVNADLEQSRAAEANAIEVAEATAREMEEAKLKLQKLTEENASLPLVVESLKAEVEEVTTGLLALKKKESKTVSAASATAANAELEKAKAELSAALLAEGKAKEAMESLTSALQQVTFEANEAKSAATAAIEEAQHARLEAEQARATLSVLESQLQEALNVAGEARGAEILATDQLESLKKTIASSVSDKSEPVVVLPNSKEDYEALHKKLQETEDLVSKRLAAAESQVEAVRASERELIMKLEAAKEETEANKVAAQEALLRAEKAASAKSAVENELRKRRAESEQRRKMAEVARSSPLNGNGGLLASTPEDKDVRMESLSQVLQVKIPNIDEKTVHMEQITLPKTSRKTSISKRLGSYISRRKH